MSTETHEGFLETVLNLSRHHREHEKFYARVPLERAVALQASSRVIKALAERWRGTEPGAAGATNPYAGCEDLNVEAATEAGGVLYMEGGGEPVELVRLRRDLGMLATDFDETGSWLAEAMESSWRSAEALIGIAPLADLLGERHRIIANDWQAAGLSSLAGRLLRRAAELLGVLDLSPGGVRADLGGARAYPAYLISASELVDRAADLAAESAVLVHENERRWRVFRERVEALSPKEA